MKPSGCPNNRDHLSTERLHAEELHADDDADIRRARPDRLHTETHTT